MASYNGKDGVVKIGVNAIAEVRSWQLSESADTVENTVMGDPEKSFVAGLNEWEGSIDCYWDADDANGQEALATGLSAGTTVALDLYPSGVASGNEHYSGDAIVTGISRQASNDGLVEVSFNFKGTGELAIDSVA